MKKIILIILAISTIYGQNLQPLPSGNDRSAEYLSSFYRMLVNVKDTTLSVAGNDSLMYLQDGIGNVIPIRVGPKGVDIQNQVSFNGKSYYEMYLNQAIDNYYHLEGLSGDGVINLTAYDTLRVEDQTTLILDVRFDSTATTGNQALLCGANGNYDYLTIRGGENKFRFRDDDLALNSDLVFNATGAGGVNGIGYVKDNNFHSVAFVGQDSLLYLYIDGVFYDSTTTPNANFYFDRFGRFGNNIYKAKFSIANAVKYNYALEQSELYDYLLPEKYTQINASDDDLVTNGTFVTDSDWSKGTGWTIGSGVASCDGTQTATSNLSQSGLAENYTDYVYSFDVASYTAGNIRLNIGSSGISDWVSAVGHYSFMLSVESVAGTSISIQADADFVGSVDNVTLRKAGKVWHLGQNKSSSSWTDEKGHISASVTDGNLVSSSTGVSGTGDRPDLFGSDGVFTFIFTGQSNMGGANTGGGDLTTDSRVKGWNQSSEKWVIADPSETDQDEAWFEGMELGEDNNNIAFHFAKRIAERFNVQVRAFGRTAGGAIIGKWVGNGTSSEYYADLDDMITDAGVTEIDAIIIHHGESAFEYTQSAYLDSLEMLKNQFYAESYIDSNHVRIIFGELSEDKLGERRGAMNPIIRTLSNNWKEYNIATAPMVDLATGSDSVHFTGTSLMIGGRERYYNSWLDLPNVTIGGTGSSGTTVLRSINLSIRDDGTYLDITNAGLYDATGYNAPTLTAGANLSKGNTVGSYSLSSDGTTITIHTTYALGIYTASVHMQDVNNSTTTYNYFPYADVVGGDIELVFWREAQNNVDHSSPDITGIMSSSDKMIISILYASSN